MSRVSLPILVIALLMPLLAAAQKGTEVDVNHASIADLEKLPGITPVLARKIAENKPYSKPEDLRRAGLSDTLIRQIRGLVIFIEIQHEIPGKQLGIIAKSEEHGAPTMTVKVERGEVVYVSGNDLVVKAEDDSLRHFNNVPDSVTVTVDGKQLNVHQLKPGMKLERQTITTSTPKTITTVQTVEGKVWHVNPPLSVTLTMDNGENQTFKIPSGQKFTVDGKETDAFGLKKGMRVSAQKVTEVPETVIAQQIKRTGTAPPPPKQDEPILIAGPAPPSLAAAQSAAEAAPAALPKTGSPLPLIGLLGALSLAVSFGLRAIHRRAKSVANIG